MQAGSLKQKLADALNQATAFEGICFRSVPQRFANLRDVLSERGSLLFGGRYNYVGLFGALYLSCDIHTCIEEVIRSFDMNELEIAHRLPRTVVAIRVRLNLVLDLINAAIRRRLRLKKADLYEDWEYSQNVLDSESLTQQIGRYARDAHFEALCAPSCLVEGRNLVVFPDRVASTSMLEIINVESLPPEPLIR